jgi:riboflavin biosynthesis pyrimidine reductase
MNEYFWFGNIAISLDQKLGKVNTRTNISNDLDFKIVNDFRNNICAIGVGSNTIMVDDPSLNVKEHLLGGKKVLSQPIVIIFDRRGVVTLDKEIFNKNNNRTNTNVGHELPKNIHLVKGVDLIDIKNKIENTLSDIGVYGAIMIEGGASFIHSCLSEGVLEYLRIFSNDKIIGQDGVQFRFDKLTNYKLIYDNKLDNGIEYIYKLNPK